MLLFLNDIAGSEILVILIFILMFFGSKSIPGIARTMGKTIRQIKDASSELQHEIKKSGADMKKDLNLQGLFEDTARDIRQPLDQYVSDLEDAVKYEAPKNSQIPSTPIAKEIPESTQSEALKLDQSTEVAPEKENKPDTTD
jgi:sec-independent protein translocase protein TatA